MGKGCAEQNYIRGTTIEQKAGPGAIQIGQVFGNVTIKVLQLLSTTSVIIILLTLAGATLGTLYAYDRSQRPARMTGDFNVAVAEFEAWPQSTEAQEIASQASQIIFSFLDSASQAVTFELIQVAHDKIGTIPGAQEAQELAEAIGADAVLYGDLHVMGDKALIVPKVYVAEAFRADVGELGGQHRFALPIEFSTADLLSYDSPGNVLLRQQTAILIEFVKALAYLASDDLLFAREAIESAIEYAEQVGDFEGKEVLYLVASEIARLLSDFTRSQEYVTRALQLNASYARAYIAQANIHYDQENLPLALDCYERAAGIEDQPLGAYVREKANLGIGNIYNYQVHTVSRNELATEAEKQALAELSLSHYQSVIDSCRQHTRPEARLRELAAASWYGLGMVHQLRGEFDLAIRAFQECLELTQDPDLRGRAQRRLDELTPGPSDRS